MLLINRRFSKKAFSFIELIVAIMVMGVAFIPLLDLFQTSTQGVLISGDKTTALHLAREGMERIKNMNFSLKKLEETSLIVYPEKGKPPIVLNQKEWRIKTEVIEGSRPLEVHVKVYKNNAPQPELVLSTMFEDLS